MILGLQRGRVRWTSYTAAAALILATAGCGTQPSETGARAKVPAPRVVSAAQVSDAAVVTAPPVEPTPPDPTGPLDVIPTTTAPPAPTIEPPVPVVVIPIRSATLDQLSIPQSVAPVRLRVDGTSIDAAVTPTSAKLDTGELAIPPKHDVIGWYEYGPSPGEAGSAVLAAHVDWDYKLGAFYELINVPVGATVVVTLEDGREVPFTVTSVEEIPKDELPLDRVFRRDGDPQLVLITCGGKFDRKTRHYADNIVAFAIPS
jgi:Sortase domain